MNRRWLAAHNIQHVRDVISAINTLALNLKLQQVGIDTDADEVLTARVELETFLDEMASVVHQIEGQAHRPVFGTELYLRHLAESLIETPNAPHYRRAFARPAELKAYLGTSDPDEKERLVSDLRALRHILEEEIQDDAQPLGAL